MIPVDGCYESSLRGIVSFAKTNNRGMTTSQSSSLRVSKCVWGQGRYLTKHDAGPFW